MAIIRITYQLLLAILISHSVLYAQSSKVINRKDTSIYLQADQAIFPFSYDGKMGLINSEHKVILPAVYSRIGPVANNFRSYEVNGKWGFLRANGEVLIAAVYDHVGFFSDGLATVSLNKQVTFADTTGKLFKQWYDEAYPFQNNFASVRIQKLWGAIDITGTTVVEMKYQHVAAFSDDSLARVKLNGKYGFVNTSGRLVIQTEYDDALHFSDGLSAVKKNNKWGYINKQGIIVIAFQYSDAGNFSNGLAPAKKKRKYGYINPQGSTVIPFVYRNAYAFNNNAKYTSVKISPFTWKRIDRQGNIVE